MINIRKNVFETNSSSMHSLVITKTPRKYTDKELALEFDAQSKKDEFYLWDWIDESDMCFERGPFQILSTPLQKLRYYSAYTLGTWRGEPKKSDIKRIKDFIMQQTGIEDPAKIILYYNDRWEKEKNKNKNYGQVCSNDTGEEPMHFVKRKGIDWKDLILNPKYIIIIDGDETQDFKSLIDARIINTDNFEDISSGIDFWNDANLTIYMNWLAPDNRWSDEEPDEYFIEDINDKTKTIDFKITEQEEIEEYHQVIDRIKNIIKLAKEKKCDIISRFVIANWTTKEIDYASVDMSIFDKFIIEESED